ncbi:MAG: hypothetical protein ACR2OR_01590 [Hyphomicrobiales bacterium]
MAKLIDHRNLRTSANWRDALGASTRARDKGHAAPGQSGRARAAVSASARTGVSDIKEMQADENCDP